MRVKLCVKVEFSVVSTTKKRMEYESSGKQDSPL